MLAPLCPSPDLHSIVLAIESDYPIPPSDICDRRLAFSVIKTLRISGILLLPQTYDKSASYSLSPPSEINCKMEALESDLKGLRTAIVEDMEASKNLTEIMRFITYEHRQKYSVK